MQENTTDTAGAAVARDFPTAPNRANLTLRELADVYMAAFNGRDHARHYDVAFWVRELGDRCISELDADTIADVLDHYAETPVTKFVGRDKNGDKKLRTFGRRAASTINRKRSVISAMLTWAQRKRLTPRGWRNPVRDIPTEPVSNGRVRFLSVDERDRLLKICRVNAWPRMYLFVLMALTTGARRGELLRLRHSDIDQPAGTAHVCHRKNGDERVLPLVPAVVNEIRRFGKANPDALLFESTRRPGKAMETGKIFNSVVREARIEKFRFHDTRHTCASYLAQNGATLIELADMLGHKTLNMVRRYAHLTTGHKAALVNRVLGNIS